MKNISKFITTTGHEVSIESDIIEVWVEPFTPGYSFIDTIRPRGHMVRGQVFRIDGKMVTKELADEMLSDDCAKIQGGPTCPTKPVSGTEKQSMV